ncbi:MULTISPECIES: PQQ-dependent dehydrogenase, methanol/ethanol family [unclassified Hyphomonas]|jgi:quinohemoprotein ethanol dehydrogenase|uniref:Quino(Hemo)protein alcohol dehydrogenase, PQQ-dependent n=3 Tax=root TaxID=1 RepID=A0A160TZA2_9ZZZZ|nr:MULTISPECIES: PQQ-dependent dehydrogenase, methanol/ethanol family [unclassified Hyphomonas]MAL44021.1 PQQ-dependent dehydrogenase, methanol/ethanol family [Hyphomonas sp.]MBG67429.1 PQQ-dependent dehydrogenase, methanol/ethanol family [Hyphomonas sp.]HBJ39676.1 PQQ-dependent dehydrogenase, methanol/ethanol family [Hyphomonas sp.]HBN91521.1 PQQ-dependent dehydrogenase, methanol/ethanol family [Hyphomonas sp.]HBU32790.1 PQQ-dependent dehydrogenase, methanol/ethanol family [Hyphomonas sp.]|tara:strand:- start:3493 stop:5649 length:2157 start_codon:yes stop_codon:yes gene_type:complete
MANWQSTLIAGASFAILAACGQAKTADTETPSEPEAFAAVDTNRISTASAADEWLTYGGTYDEQRHSSLIDVNKETVADLGVAWTYDLATNRGVESTPIVVDGVMYVTSAWSLVYALDAKTGEELWVYDPDVDRAVGVKACCDVVNRGVAVYDGKVFVGVIDGRLEALDAETGEVVWSKVTVDQSKPYTITGAPRVVNGKVLIGNGGAELGVRGYLSAYDANTGDKVWRFYTVPNPEKQPDGEISDAAFEDIGNVTWGDEGAWVTDGGGGTVWDSIVYDEVNDQIIFGVGNGSPWNREFRDPSGGDNLFLSSIVAVDAETGAYKWHFQTTPGDNWDYTATQTIILADLPVGEDGEARRVAMQAPKNGFFYVLDAESGEFISGDAFVPMNWAEGLDENGRPIEIADARYGAVPYEQLPGPLGAHNWHPMAFNPDLNLAYIPAQEIPQAYARDPRFETQPVGWNTGADFSAGVPPIAPPEVAKFLRSTLKGRLIAWDPIAREARWSVEHGNAWNGGVLSTAGGLVFQGKLNGDFVAYDAETGDKLWNHELKSGGASGPGTYMIDGEQYVTITTGWGSAFGLSAGFAYDETVPSTVGKVVTFKLGGTGEIADPDFPMIDKTPKADSFGDETMIAEGSVHYARNCTVCHGPLAVSSGVLPDLRWSAISGNEMAWKGVVIDGNLAANGMVSFADHLTPDQVESIRAYVLAQAHAAVPAGSGGE